MDPSDEKQPTHFGQWSKNSEDILKNHFPLHRCCRDGDVDTLSLLLMKAQHGIYTEDCFYGWTPVHWAAYFGKLGCLRKLMSVTRVGIDCDILTAKFKQTPCHVAAYGGHPYLLQWLLRSGANTDAQDYLGETPLHKAARTGSIDCISLLISHGADVRAENNRKKTPGDLAESCGYLECFQFLNATMSQNGPPASLTQTKPSGDRGPGLNGGLIPPMSPTISSNGHSQTSDDCAMDTVDACPVTNNGCHRSLFQPSPQVAMVEQVDNGHHYGNGHTPVQGSYGFQPNNGHMSHQAPMDGSGDNNQTNGDILLADGVGRNSTPVAGRKRSREDEDEIEYKRFRTSGQCAEPGPSLVVHNNAQCSACVHMIDEVDGPHDLSPAASILQVPTNPMMSNNGSQPQQQHCICSRSLYVPPYTPPEPTQSLLLLECDMSSLIISPMASILQVSTSPFKHLDQRLEPCPTTAENYMIFVT